MEISEYPNLLTPQECDFLIKAAADAGLSTAETLGDNSGYRTADNCWLYESNNVTAWIERFLSEQLNVPIDNFEDAHIVRYFPGGEYKEHHDWFSDNQEGSGVDTSGNRTHSFIVYLNDDFNGGETEFTFLNQKVKAEKGKGLLWSNMLDGKCLEESEHAGLPVTEGVKWILIYWIRENKFR